VTTSRPSRLPATATTADIDVQLVAARWRHLHAVWADDADRVRETAATLDRLLELRHLAAMQAGDGSFPAA
jgi:hypothetical protein